MTFEERYKKIYEAMVCGRDEIAVRKFNRLITGDLKHVGDWIAEGDEYITVSGTRMAVKNAEFHLYTGAYTRAPKTMLVNGIEVPAAESEEPNYGAWFWMPSPESPTGVAKFRWCRSDQQRRILKNRALHLSRVNCLAHSSALGWTK